MQRSTLALKLHGKTSLNRHIHTHSPKKCRRAKKSL
jgi:hypothetical protein